LGCDVASAGELAIALAAGFDRAHILLHGNAKSDEDIGAAIEAGVGLIVLDGPDDVERIERLSRDRRGVLLRVNPAVPGETHAAMDTGSAEATGMTAAFSGQARMRRPARAPTVVLCRPDPVTR